MVLSGGKQDVQQESSEYLLKQRVISIPGVEQSKFSVGRADSVPTITSSSINIIIKPKKSQCNLQPQTTNIFKYKSIIYHVLFHPRSYGHKAMFYHGFVCALLLMDLLFLSLSTVPELRWWTVKAETFTDILIFIVLSLELSLGLWVAPINPRYRGCSGIIRYLFSLSTICDIILILIIAGLLAGQFFYDEDDRPFEWIRFVQIFKICRIDTPFRRWRLICSVIWSQREELCIIIHVCLMILLLLSFAVFFAEQQDPDTAFNSIPATFWWSIISLLSIGYGDMVPQTVLGKFIASVIFMFSITLYAVPSGIIGTGIALKLEEERRQKKMSCRRLPAALLIQWAWRFYVVCKINPKIDLATSDGSRRSSRFMNTLSAIIRYHMVEDNNKLPNETKKEQVPGTIGYNNNSNNTNNSKTSSKSCRKFVQCFRQLLLTGTGSEGNFGRHGRFSLGMKELLIIKILCFLQFQLARLRYQSSNPYGDITELITRYQLVHNDMIKRFQTIVEQLESIDRKIDTNRSITSSTTHRNDDFSIIKSLEPSKEN